MAAKSASISAANASRIDARALLNALTAVKKGAKGIE
jgi:hypothetical protein